MSIRIKVIDGTPIHSGNSLCHRCEEGQIIKGQQVSDETVICHESYYRPFRIIRPVVECNRFRERMTKSKGEMEKIAWVLETNRGRPIGFFNPIEHKYRL